MSPYCVGVWVICILQENKLLVWGLGGLLGTSSTSCTNCTMHHTCTHTHMRSQILLPFEESLMTCARVDPWLTLKSLITVKEMYTGARNRKTTLYTKHIFTRAHTHTHTRCFSRTHRQNPCTETQTHRHKQRHREGNMENEKSLRFSGFGLFFLILQKYLSGLIPSTLPSDEDIGGHTKTTDLFVRCSNMMFPSHTLTQRSQGLPPAPLKTKPEYFHGLSVSRCALSYASFYNVGTRV